jgi:geranylgeranyl pyrophosphate synthase
MCVGGPADLLNDFGSKLGLAFQLFDDVLDVVGHCDQTGKRRGVDLLDGTVTLPLILARQADRELRDLDLRSVSDASTAERVCDQIAQAGGAAKTHKYALSLVEEAKQLVSALPKQQRLALEQIADQVVNRFA